MLKTQEPIELVCVGKKAPNFIAKAVMSDQSVIDLNLADYIKGKKCILFFYPLNFTFVCPSEIISFNNHLGAFTQRNTEIISVSVDSHHAHLIWKGLRHDKGGIGNIMFPMVSDLQKAISNKYNVLTEEGISLRGTFFIDEDFIVRHISVNDMPVGRNVEEYLRIIDAFDHYKQNKEVCPAGWRTGKAAIDPTYEGVADYLTTNAEDI